MPFVRVVARVSLVAAGMVVVGCSGDEASTDASSSFVDRYCGIVAQCCGQSGYPSDGAACRTSFEASAGRELDATKGDECLAGLRALSAANPKFCGADYRVAACGETYRGTRVAGAACNASEDCARSPDGKVECAPSYATDPPTQCKVLVRGNEGDACVATEDEGTLLWLESNAGTSRAGATPVKATFCGAADLLRCDSFSERCVRIGDVGSACAPSSDAYQCVKGAYCDTAQSKCVARVAAGGDCSAEIAREVSRMCAEGNYCDEATKKCTPSLDDGAACERNAQCKSRNCTSGTCASSSGGLALLCGPKPGG